MPHSEFRIGGKVFLDNNQTDKPDYIIMAEANDPGGTADVFIAKEPSVNNRIVAIKRFGTNRLFEIYYEKEIRGLTDVHDKCKNAPVHLIATAKNQQYVVLEYAESTLWNEIEKNQPFSVEDVYNIIKNLTKKVACIHIEAGRIHRDLKPQNILYLTGGNHNDLRLGDFGASTSDSHSMTFTSTPATFAYAAPEILSGMSNGNAFTSDVFSLGMILYILLDGTEILPQQFDHITCLNRNKAIANEIRQKIEQETYKRQIDWKINPETYGKYIALLKIACKALQPEPENRYADAGEMSEHIEAWEKELAILELRTSLGDEREKVKIRLEYRNHREKKEWAFELAPESDKRFYFADAGKSRTDASLTDYKPFEKRVDLKPDNPHKILIYLEKRGEIHEKYFYGSLLISLLILYPLILNTWASWIWGAHLPEFSSGFLIDWFSLTIWGVRIYPGEYGLFLAPLVILHYWSRKVDASNRLFGRRVGDFWGYVLVNLLCIAYFYLILTVTAFEGPVLANNYGNYYENRFLSEFAENGEESLKEKSWWVQRGLMLALPCKKGLCEKQYQVGVKVLEKFGNDMPEKDAWDTERVLQAVNEVAHDSVVQERIRAVLGKGKKIAEEDEERKRQAQTEETERRRLAEQERESYSQKLLAEQAEAERQKQAASKPAKTITNSIGMKFVFIPPGSFIMGSPENEPGRYSDETQHRVTLTNGFYMQTTEVTQEQWKAVMRNNPSYFKDCGDNCPVEEVSWNDVQEFIKKLNQKESTAKYRLPTEAEWEYAARAGTTTPFAFGKCLSTDQANYDGNYPLEGCSKGKYREKTMPVASFNPNNWGLYDMQGNVWEWCSDWYGDYPASAVTDPTGSHTGSGRVLRGGGWISDAWLCRSADRVSNSPGNRYDALGFRLALSQVSKYCLNPDSPD